MKEVILNDECMHCNDRECHDGEHFCNQAMKENSFYKNARLYKGLEVIHRPTYAELEKENAELKESVTKLSKDGLDFLHSMRSNRNCIDCESRMSIQLVKAKEIIKKFSEFVNNEIEYDPEHPQEHTDLWNKLCEQAEQFMKED